MARPSASNYDNSFLEMICGYTVADDATATTTTEVLGFDLPAHEMCKLYSAGNGEGLGFYRRRAPSESESTAIDEILLPGAELLRARLALVIAPLACSLAGMKQVTLRAWTHFNEPEYSLAGAGGSLRTPYIEWAHWDSSSFFEARPVAYGWPQFNSLATDSETFAVLRHRSLAALFSGGL